jgi:hypothetical protein
VALGKKSRAIRGGGGNFGVVTQFQFKLHEVGAEILAGLIVFPFHLAKQMLTQYREFVESASEELNWKSHNFTELSDGAYHFGLPVTASDVFGREEDIAFLDDAWANQQANVVTFALIEYLRAYIPRSNHNRRGTAPCSEEHKAGAISVWRNPPH